MFSIMPEVTVPCMVRGQNPQDSKQDIQRKKASSSILFLADFVSNSWFLKRHPGQMARVLGLAPALLFFVTLGRHRVWRWGVWCVVKFFFRIPLNFVVKSIC